MIVQDHIKAWRNKKGYLIMNIWDFLEFVNGVETESSVKRSDLFSYKTKHYYLFSKFGFTKGCIDKANEIGNVALVTYDDIVNG